MNMFKCVYMYICTCEYVSIYVLEKYWVGEKVFT